MTAHHIKLQSSVGDFSPEFIQELPALEKAMREHGLDPSGFVIARNLAQITYLPIVYRPDGNLIEYTVFVNGRSFTVTQPDDLRFLEYFYELCVAKDEHQALTHNLRPQNRKLGSRFRRVVRWFNKPI